MTGSNFSYLVHISAGHGPAECALAVAKFTHYLQREAGKHQVLLEILDALPGPKPGTYVSVLIRLSGRELAIFVEPLMGTHVWICKSPYRPHHKRKNWFIDVSSLPKPPEGALAINLEDISWKTARASGPGGQHVNKTESAVQALHRPSGVRVTVSKARSQFQNKKLAIEKIKTCLWARAQSTLANHHQHRWQKHRDVERGKPIKRFQGRAFRELCAAR